MTADTILTHELESLHQKLAGLHRKRRSQPTDRSSAKKAERPEKTAEEHGLQKEILEFIKLIANYVEEAKVYRHIPQPACSAQWSWEY